MTADPQTIDRPEGDARGPRRMQDAVAGMVAEARDRLSRTFNIDPEQRRLEELERQRRIRELFDFTLRDHFTDAATGNHFRTFYTNLENAYSNKFTAPRLSPAYRGSDIMYAMYKDVDIHNNIIENNHGNVIRLSADTIKFDQTTREDFNMDDAFEMALLAAHSKDMAGGKIKLTGTPRERAMLQHAIEQVNAAMDTTIDPPDTIFVKNPVDIKPEWFHEFAPLTLDRYLKKMGALPTPGMVFEPDEEFDLGPPPPAPPPPAPPPPAPPPPAPPPIVPLDAAAQSPEQEHSSAHPFAGASGASLFDLEETPAEKALNEKADIEDALLYYIQREPNNQPPGEFRGRIETENGKFEVFHVNVDAKKDGNPVRVQYFFDSVAGRPVLMYVPKGNGYEDLQEVHTYGDYTPDLSLGPKAQHGPDVIPAAPDGFSLFSMPAFGDGVGRRAGGADNEPITVDYHVVPDEVLDRSERQIKATLDALVEQLQLRGWGKDIAYVGQVTGSVTFGYDKQEWFKTVKATTEQHLFTAQIDLYEDGKTPPAQIEYVKNERTGNIHLVSIARGEGYEGYTNNPVSRGVQRFPEEDWLKPEKGSPVLNAAKYYLPQAQFEDEAGADANVQKTPPPVQPAGPVVASNAKFASGLVAPVELVHSYEAGDGLTAQAPSVLKEFLLLEDVLKGHFRDNPFKAEDFVQSGRTKGFLGRDVYVAPIEVAGKDTRALVHFYELKPAKDGKPGQYKIVSIEGNGTDFVPQQSIPFNKSEHYQFNGDFAAPIINNTKLVHNRFDHRPPAPPAPPAQNTVEAGQEGGDEAPAPNPRSSKLAQTARDVVGDAVQRLVKGARKSHMLLVVPFAAGGLLVSELLKPSESEATTNPSFASLTSRTDLRPETAKQITLEPALRVLGRIQPREVAPPRAAETVVASLPPANFGQPVLRHDASLTDLRMAVQYTPQAAGAQLTVRSRYTNLTNLDSRVVAFIHDLDTLYAQCADPDRDPGDPLRPQINYGRDGSHYTQMHPEGRAIDLRANSTRDNRSGHDNAPTSSETRCLTRLFDRVERSYGLRIGYKADGGYHWHVGASRAGAHRHEDDTPRNEVSPDPVLPPEQTAPDAMIAAVAGSEPTPMLAGAENTDVQPPVNVASGGAPAGRMTFVPAL